MPRLDKSCSETILCSECPLKNCSYLCELANQREERNFEDIINKVKGEIESIYGTILKK